MTDQFVVELGGGGLPAQLVGGKGAWLDRLVAAGFPVPTCVTVTTESYRAVARHPTISSLLASLHDERRDARGPGDVQRTLDEAFLSVPLPPAVDRALSDIAARLTSPGAPMLAVRSSATAEDMTTMSFAGQYRSFLNVETEREVLRAIRLVWASLWHPAPHAYRRFHAVDESDLGMAVVLMPMVAAQRAGVAFSVDPRHPDCVRVESVDGLGEQLVSGSVTPHVSLVPRSRTLERDCEGDDLDVRVARLALRVEEAFERPQDIEWAWDGAISLLQARPIASARPGHDDGFDTPSQAGGRWTTAGILETLPGVLPPLQWETAGFLVDEAFRRLFDALDVLPELSSSGPVIGRFRGRAALNLGVVEQMASALPGGSPEDVEVQYFGRATGERPATRGTARSGRLRAARHDLAMLRLRRVASREAETVIAATRTAVTVTDLRTRSVDDLLTARRHLLDLSGRAFVAEVAVASSSVASFRRLESWLMRRFPRRDAERWAQALTTRHVSSSWWVGPAAEIARLPTSDRPRLAAAPDWSAAQEVLRAVPSGRRVRDGLVAAARDAGSMAVFGGPCWDENLDHVWSLVRSASVAADGGTVDGRAAAAPDDRMWAAFGEALTSVPRGPAALPVRIVDERVLHVRRLVEQTLELLDRRERSKAAVLALGGQLRRLQLELGSRLVAAGFLDRPQDVELLGERELLEGFDGGCPSRAELSRRRRWLDRCLTEQPLPERFEGRPTPQRGDQPQGTELRGWAAGAGVFTGRARVVSSPFGDLDPGEVLVATTTDASWSPLFLRAGAIAVERGGPLSHAAILARELGIPAVLNVPGLVASFDGRPAIVQVDGDRGRIVILDRDEPRHEGGTGPLVLDREGSRQP
jgi:pyruvate,water dikinase